MIAFNKYYNQFNILSVSLVVVSLFFLIFKGLNFGIDFKGGTLIELRSNDNKINVSASVIWATRDASLSLSPYLISDVAIVSFSLTIGK